MAAPAEAPTIFAAASGAGRAAIQVLRISGPASGRLLDALCRTRPPPRQASLRTLRCGAEVLDRALVLWLPGPGTYTGEDCAELHLHGGLAVLEGVAAALAGLGARPAEPGELTRRAFVNGRLDLVQAEAVADLVEAETTAQRLQALDQLQGGLSALCRDWAERIRRIAAFQEALIDFADEALPPGTEAEILQTLAGLHREIVAHLARGPQGERLRAGLVFAVVGPPNVGKSSLVNALAARAVAIVSPLPGTTRDAIEVRLDLDGVPVTLVDTAGLRAPQDDLEAEGIRRARARAEEADLVLAVADASAGTGDATAFAPGWRVLRIANKVDLVGAASVELPGGAIAVSARTGWGLDRLRGALAQEAARLTGRGGPARLTRARHREALEAAARGLAEAEQATWPELRAEALRHALDAIGRLTGAVGVEDLLDTVFRSFCIGK